MSKLSVARGHGSHDLNVFLLQDLQGALFFHPLLSAVVGAISGLAGAGIAQGIGLLQRRLGQPSRPQI